MKKIIYMLLICTLTISTYAQNYEHIVNYNFNGTPVNGVKIKTNIPFSHGLGMPTIKIEGFNYNRPGLPVGVTDPAMLNLILGWYVYDNNFYSTTISNAGGTAPSVWLSNENGKIAIFIDQKIYYQRFTVSAFAQEKAEKPEYFQGWVVVDEPRGGTTQTQMVYKNVFGGNVGIGTETPQHPLDVNGGFRVAGASIFQDDIILKTDTQESTPLGSYGKRLYFGNKIADNGDYIWIARYNVATNYSDLRINIGDDSRGGDDRFVVGNIAWDAKGVWKDWFVVNNAGKVGIGISNPQYALDVKGKIHAEEVLIDLNFLADYVFKPDYKLMPLNELEQFVQTNSHLPEIPSAEEVAEKGLSIGEMQNKLLQKIEELTLYIIQQDKRIQELEKSQQNK